MFRSRHISSGGNNCICFATQSPGGSVALKSMGGTKELAGFDYHSRLLAVRNAAFL